MTKRSCDPEVACSVTMFFDVNKSVNEVERLTPQYTLKISVFFFSISPHNHFVID